MPDEQDLFRYCGCGADCCDDEPDHAADCPQATGVYRVRYEAMHAPCEHCGKRPDPSIHCSECHCTLAIGAAYVHRELDLIDGMPVYEPICLGCAAVEALT